MEATINPLAPTTEKVRALQLFKGIAADVAEAELASAADEASKKISIVDPEEWAAATAEVEAASAALEIAQRRAAERRALIAEIEDSIVQLGRLRKQIVEFRAWITPAEEIAAAAVNALWGHITTPCAHNDSLFGALSERAARQETLREAHARKLSELESGAEREAHRIAALASENKISLPNLMRVMRHESATSDPRRFVAGLMDDGFISEGLFTSA